ncbi:MAG TPA: GNAT family N-acetyltransferase [Candidatus Deferrimicrobium sp.]|nr:GNAT family N-acetyltransferase [Candidatus Deferrimicrobium sp.]
MSDLQLRSLHRDDLDRVCGIESRITGHSRKGFLEKRFAAAAESPDGFIACAAVRDGKLAGYAIARIQEGEFGAPGAVAALDVVGIDPDAQGRGIGKALLAEMERRMKDRGIETLRTQVDWENPAMIRFFSSTGFRLAPSQVLERDTSPLRETIRETGSAGPEGRSPVRAAGGDYEPLSRDRVPVRSLLENDLAAVVRIDRKLTGRDRSAYYAAKLREMLTESGIRVSLVAEEDGFVVGFVMARVDFGEFGKVDKAAILDTIGVHPGFAGSGIGHALLSQLFLNLSTLQVETVLTQVSPENVDLQRFLYSCGFHPSQRLVLSKTVS